jgi:hypothetical protein
MADEKPKIIVDDDWKAQARAEKERLAAEQEKKAQAAAAAGGVGAAPGGVPAGERAAGGRGEIPPASFITLVSTVASQALFALGAVPDPQSGRRYVNLDLAKHQIDTLKVLEEKTKGNLTEEEKSLLDRTLYELRTHYVQMAQRVAKL